MGYLYSDKLAQSPQIDGFQASKTLSSKAQQHPDKPTECQAPG